MKRLVLLTGLFGFLTASAAAETKGIEQMLIKMEFADKTVVIAMENNSAAQEVIDRLPATLEFIDFAGEEKITNWDEPLSLRQAPRGMIATAGKMFIYAPWGNMGFFYKDHGHRPDKDLIPLGVIKSGLAELAAQKGGFTAVLSVMDKGEE